MEETMGPRPVNNEPVRQKTDDHPRSPEPGKTSRSQIGPPAADGKMLESLCELLPNAVVVVDRQERIIQVNAEAERLFGYSSKELIGKDHGILVPERLRLRHHTEVTFYMENPHPRIMGIGLNLRGLRKDGVEFPVDIDLGPLELGKDLYVVCVVRDATKRKQLEDSLNDYRQRLEQMVAERTSQFVQANEKLTMAIGEYQQTEEGLELRAAILDNVLEAIFLISTKGDFLYANEAAVKMHGYSRDEMLRMNLSQFLRTEDAAVIPARLQEILRAGQLDVEVIHVRKDRSLVRVQIRHSLIKTRHGQAIVSVTREIT